jgi:hypothetical protein
LLQYLLHYLDLRKKIVVHPHAHLLMQLLTHPRTHPQPSPIVSPRPSSCASPIRSPQKSACTFIYYTNFFHLHYVLQLAVWLCCKQWNVCAANCMLICSFYLICFFSTIRGGWSWRRRCPRPERCSTKWRRTM